MIEPSKQFSDGNNHGPPSLGIDAPSTPVTTHLDAVLPATSVSEGERTEDDKVNSNIIDDVGHRSIMEDENELLSVYIDRASSPYPALSEEMDLTPPKERNNLLRPSGTGSTSGRRSGTTSRASTPPPLEIPVPDGTPRGQFLHDLYSFMKRIGQPITKIPYLGFQELDLYFLYQLVISRGGMDAVTKKQEWKTVYQELGIPTMSTSASYNTRTNYKKYLYLYELEYCDFNERRPLEAEPRFKIGEYVRIVSANYDGQVFYAKVIKCRWRNNRNMYYVHYNGWSNSHDEWMPEAVLGKLLPEENQNPSSLPNPHPNRSSKSNHIIGEPPPAHEGERSVKSSKRPSRASSDVESEEDHEGGLGEDEEDEYVGSKYESTGRSKKSSPVKRGKQSPEKSKPTTIESGRSLRLKLRSRGEKSTTSSMMASGEEKLTRSFTGPSLERIQIELEKLEDGRFLDAESAQDHQQKQPRQPIFLSLENLHERELMNLDVGSFNSQLLQTVDLRVPDLNGLVGAIPSSSLEGTNSPLLSVTTSTSDYDKVGRRENIQAMERELITIKKEYRKKKKLLELYYGPSDISSSSSNSEPSALLTGDTESVSIEINGSNGNKARLSHNPSHRRYTRRARS